jgi:UDP-glucose 4-epimerase
MRILVTGGTGFIGRHLLPELANEHELFSLTRSAPPADATDVTWIEQDLAEELDPARLPESIDAVVHLAQSKRYREFPAGAPDMFAVNVKSTFRLLEYARAAGATHFLFASTGGVYGSGEDAFSEADKLNPLNFYLASKCSAEALVAGYRTTFVTVVFRFFFVYGADQAGMLIPSLIQKARSGEEIVIEGDPGLRINPIHVRDAVRSFAPALELERSNLFNVAGDETITITELVRQIEEVLGVTAEVRHTSSERPGDLIGANKKMKEVLGVQPAISLVEGIRSMT